MSVAVNDSPSIPSGRPSPMEWLAIAAFLAPNLLFPLLYTDLYPFSRAPMFEDAPTRYCEYQVKNPQGQALDLREIGLQRNYWGNPIGIGVGFHPRPTLDRVGQIASKEEVTAQVQRFLGQHPDIPYVLVTQDILGPIDDWHVGSIQQHIWRVDNPTKTSTKPT